MPDTTLAAETGNNTSAANTFKTLSDGDVGATNVSKVSMKNLLYPGSTAKLYVHLMPWFGPSNHMNVGYDSADPAQIHRQIDDMMSRGIDGAIVDWYGPNNTHHNTATINFMHDAETRGGNFVFSAAYDSGALKSCAATAGCNLTTQTISDLNYLISTFASSPAYMRINGRPVLPNFGLEKYSLDWNAIRAGVAGNPLFINRNAGGFTKPQTDGAYSWVAPETVSSTDPMAINYLSNWYNASLTYNNLVGFSSSYAGFNDTLAAWGSGRIIDRQCGLTWLTTIAKAAQYYNLNNQLDGLQVATWNDYEEGTEIESGIENCVSVSAAVSGTQLSWSITGQENTLDHYTVFISADGTNLQTLGNYPTGTSSVDLAQFGFAPGSYTVFVKAVGKSSIVNHISQPVQYAVAGNNPPSVALALSAAAGTAPVSIAAKVTASDSDGSITETSINFGDGTVVNGSSASHTYSTPGTYTVTASATDNFGATSTATAPVTITANQPPQVSLSLSATSGIAPVATVATATASDVDGSVSSVSIDFGDGAVVSGASASHTYSTAGTYTVKATATDNLGASSTATALVTVTTNQPPVARLSVTPTSTTTGTAVTASTTSSTDADGSVKSSTIDFGDGTVMAGFTLSHSYSAAGTYNVKATVTDNMGATSTTSTVVTVTSPSQVTVSQPLAGATTSLKPRVVASGYAPAGVIAMKIYVDSTLVYQTSASSVDTTLTLSQGAHNVTVQQWDSNQVVTKNSFSVNAVNTAPVVTLAMSATSGVSPVTTTATMNATDADGNIGSTTIDFGDGSAAVSGTSASHTYNNAGTYTVTATVKDSLGLTTTATQTVIVASATVRSVTMTSPTSSSSGTSVHVSGFATSPAPVTAMKIYVDGKAVYTTSASSTDTYLKMTVGTHTLTLQAWDSTGAVMKKSVTLTVSSNSLDLVTTN